MKKCGVMREKKGVNPLLTKIQMRFILSLKRAHQRFDTICSVIKM